VRWLLWLSGCVLLGLALAAGVFFASGSAAAPSAKALEARLLAPCCFGGTLDVHDSDVAHDLRVEIERRVASGESTDRIEADLVDRYGARIRAMPDPRAWSATTLGVAIAIGAAMIVLAMRTRAWVAAAPRATPTARGTPGVRDEYDERLDAELEDLAG